MTDLSSSTDIFAGVMGLDGWGLVQDIWTGGWSMRLQDHCFGLNFGLAFPFAREGTIEKNIVEQHAKVIEYESEEKSYRFSPYACKLIGT